MSLPISHVVTLVVRKPADRLREALNAALHATGNLGASRSGQETANHKASLALALDRFDSALKELTEWQPIDTAPKDGTEIIVFDPTSGGGRAIVSWYWESWRDDELVSWKATHWMPLTESPQ